METYGPGGIDHLSQTNKFMFDLPYDVMAIGKYAVTLFSSLSKITNMLSSHELYIYAITQDMHQNFAPKLNGRYLSSNVNLTVLDQFGRNVSVPVGSASDHYPAGLREDADRDTFTRSLREV